MTYANLAAALVRKSIKYGGATLTREGEDLTTGYAVGGILEFKFDEKECRLEDIAAALRKIEETGSYFGGWYHEGVFYLDAVRVFKNRADALKAAIEGEEIAFFDLDNQEEIKI